MQAVNAEFPNKLEPLFRPQRYKVLRGGRGSTKSWSVARALIILASQRKLDVLCAREFQSSIRDSVHKLLCNQIELLGLSALFDIQRDVIYGPHGGRFVFIGLSDKTAENMKSFEDFDICWVEEARNVSRRSWNILRPTIRKEGSEIWITFNPELDTDPVWEMFVEKPPDNAFSIEMNWRDNPWFNEVLQQERKNAQRDMTQVDYEHIWEGKCRPTIAGAIYADEVAEMYAQHRVGEYPYDPLLMVHSVWDLGWNDKMSVGLFQRQASQLRLVGYIENDHKTLDWYSRELRKQPYNWGTLFLPHDGDHGDFKTGKSAKSILQDLNWSVEVLPSLPVVDGIRAARSAFRTLYVFRPSHEPREGRMHEGGYHGCARWLECVKRYRRNVPTSTDEATTPVHDQYSHGADMWRYAAQAAPLMTNSGGLSLPPLKYNWNFR